jgi:sugar phosphate isomerase/epimerase
MLLGAHSHLFRGAPAVVAEAFQRAGLNCVELTPNFPGLAFHDPIDFTPDRCRQAIAPFVAAGIRIACLSGYANLLNPNLDLRHRDIVRLHTLIRHCRDFGTGRVVTETGSLSPSSPLVSYPPNRTRSAWSELRTIMAEVLRVASDHGVTLLLKPGPTHVLATLADAVRLREELAHPCLGFVMDPAHFLINSEPGDIRVSKLANADGSARLEELVEKLGPWTPIVHAKDLRWDEAGIASTPRVGRGMLDYGLLLRRLRPFQTDPPIILEHLPAGEIAAAREFMQRLC